MTLRKLDVTVQGILYILHDMCKLESVFLSKVVNLFCAFVTLLCLAFEYDRQDERHHDGERNHCEQCYARNGEFEYSDNDHRKYDGDHHYIRDKDEGDDEFLLPRKFRLWDLRHDSTSRPPIR